MVLFGADFVRMTDVPHQVYLTRFWPIAAEAAQRYHNVVAERLGALPFIQAIDPKRMPVLRKAAAERSGEMIVTPMPDLAPSWCSDFECDPVAATRFRYQDALKRACSVSIGMFVQDRLPQVLSHASPFPLIVQIAPEEGLKFCRER